MNHRERVKAILYYENYDRMPVVHFGYWSDTLQKWMREGHLRPEDIEGYGDGNEVDRLLDAKIGWDFNWARYFSPRSGLFPSFECTVLETLPDGRRKILNSEGVVVLEKPGTTSIPSEVDHTLKTRADWEEHYRHRLQWDAARVWKPWYRRRTHQSPLAMAGLNTSGGRIGISLWIALRQPVRPYPQYRGGYRRVLLVRRRPGVV